jgi:hypothetical protein
LFIQLYSFNYPSLLTLSDGAVAVATIYRPTFSGLKWDFGFFTALGTGGWEPLLGPIPIASAKTFRFPCLTALRAALGIVCETLICEEFLFSGTESETGSTIGTLYCLVLEAHWMTSSIELLVGLCSGHPACGAYK